MLLSDGLDVRRQRSTYAMGGARLSCRVGYRGSTGNGDHVLVLSECPLNSVRAVVLAGGTDGGIG